MSVADPPDTTQCPECGSRLSQGVCASCALGELLVATNTLSDGADPDGGSNFGRYSLIKKLAAGGMGVVYEAQDEKLKRSVALKVIRGSAFANEAEMARFTIESKAAASLDHPNIVPIYEVGHVGDQPFFTMKLVDGGNLGNRFKDNPGGMPPRQLADWLLEIARAVDHAHRRGVLHRDLKPANILIGRRGKPWLTDFGLAKLLHGDNRLTLTTDHLGTPHYMAPEVVKESESEVSTASDVWALGVILWEGLTGKPPFNGASPVEIMCKIIDEEPPSRVGDSAVDRDLLTLARRCMEKDPARRVESAGALADELGRWLEGKPLQVRPVSVAERVFKWVKRNPAWAALGAALLAGGVSSFFLWRHAEHAVDSLENTNDQLNRSLAISTATRLAMDARLSVTEDPGRALLLAVESVEHTERESIGVLPDAAEAVYETLQRIGGRDIAPRRAAVDDRNDGFISRGPALDFPVRFSPDGRWVLSFDYTSPAKRVTAAISDCTDTHAEHPIARWAMWPNHDPPLAACWMSDSKRVVAVDQTGEVRLWSPFEIGESGQPSSTVIGRLAAPGHRFVRFYLRPDEGTTGVHGIAISFPKNPQRGVRKRMKGRALEFFVGGRDEGELQVAQVLDLPEAIDHDHAIGCASDQSTVLFHTNTCVHLVRFRDSETTEREVDIYTDEIDVFFATLSPTARWLAYRGGDNGVFVADQTSEARSKPSKLATHFTRIETIAFSPDESLLAVSGNSSEVAVYRLSDGERLASLRISGEDIIVVKFSPDGRWLTAGSRDRLVAVWPVDRLGEAPAPLELRGILTPVVDIAFPPQGNLLAASGINARCRLWQLKQGGAGSLPEVVVERGEPMYDLEKSPDGRWLVAARSTGVSLVDVASGSEYPMGAHGSRATGVAIDPDGRWLASAGVDRTVRVWEFPTLVGAIRDNRPIPPPDHEFGLNHTRLGLERYVAFHPRGTLYCVCGDGILFEWDLNRADPDAWRSRIVIHGIKYLLPDAKVSPDGRWLALARHGWDPLYEYGPTQFGNMVLLFDVSEPDKIIIRAELPAGFLSITNVDFSADNRWLVAGGAGRGASVWDLHASDIAASRLESDVFAHLFDAVAFSPDLKWLALGGSNGQIHLWDWKNTGAMRTIATGDAITSFVWLSDTRLVSSGLSGAIHAWETDLDRLKHHALRIAGRNLTVEERLRYLAPFVRP